MAGTESADELRRAFDGLSRVRHKLVVDDDPSVRRSTERLLRIAGFKVQTFESAREVLDCQRPEGPGCLVLDVRFPGLNGLDLHQELGQSGKRSAILSPGSIFMAVAGISGRAGNK